jgi:hypothetical protein
MTQIGECGPLRLPATWVIECQRVQEEGGGGGFRNSRSGRSPPHLKPLFVPHDELRFVKDTHSSYLPPALFVITIHQLHVLATSRNPALDPAL